MADRVKKKPMRTIRKITNSFIICTPLQNLVKKLQTCDGGRKSLSKATFIFSGSRDMFSSIDPEQYRNVTERYGNVIERSLEHFIYRKRSSDKVKKGTF